MALSERNNARFPAILLPLLLVPAVVASAATPPPDAELNAAGIAIAAAERAQPAGPAAALLADARSRYAQAQDLAGRRKHKDAIRLAEQARAIADQALAAARLAAARAEVDEKAARNVELRRQLLVLPEDNG